MFKTISEKYKKAYINFEIARKKYLKENADNPPAHVNIVNAKIDCEKEWNIISNLWWSFQLEYDKPFKILNPLSIIDKLYFLHHAVNFYRAELFIDIMRGSKQDNLNSDISRMNIYQTEISRIWQLVAIIIALVTLILK